MVEKYEFEHPIKQISISEEYFYILGDACMYKYYYDGYHFNQIKSMNISVDETRTYYYIASFFINK